MEEFIPFKVGKNFDKIIEPQLKKPEIAIIELISNSWDAYASNVWIEWPEVDSLKDDSVRFTILDDGHGMTKDEFIDIWSKIGYDKKENPKMKTYDDGREILGKNGRGRLGLFCFADEYLVSTSKDGKISSFKIKRDEECFAKISVVDSVVEPFIKDSEVSSGTYIQCFLDKDYIDLKTVKETISLRFGASSDFQVLLNNKKMDLFNFKDEYECIIEKFNGDEIKIYKIPKNKRGMNLSNYEVVWWVKNRFVEHDTWKDLGINLDSSKVKENEFVFLISADLLENEVKSDWTGFKESKLVSQIKETISNKINQVMGDVISSTLKDKKKRILEKSREDILMLNPIGQQELGGYLEEIIKNCKSISNKDLSNLVKVLTKMEISNKKYSFFESIVNISPDDLDKLTEIVEKWSIDDAYLVLNELYNRLELIKKLELLVDDPQTREVQQLQPLFKEGLWIFHPKYEGTTRFTSNQSMNKVMAKLLNVENYHSENAKKRPDFVVLENSTLSTFTSDNYVADSEVIDGYDELLIIELKRGGSEIGYDEKQQAFRYAKEIKNSGNIKSSKITGYVLGTTINLNESEMFSEGNISIYPKQYDVIIRTAKNRTFNLIDKIKSVKGISDIGDNEINEVLKGDVSQKTLLDE